MQQIQELTTLLCRQGPGYVANGMYERVVGWVESCTECRECEPRCPYGLAIPELMRERLAEIRAVLRQAGWAV